MLYLEADPFVVRDGRTSLAPSWASRIAMCRPTPLLAPVTKITWSFKLTNSTVCLFRPRVRVRTPPIIYKMILVLLSLCGLRGVKQSTLTNQTWTWMRWQFANSINPMWNIKFLVDLSSDTIMITDDFFAYLIGGLKISFSPVYHSKN